MRKKIFLYTLVFLLIDQLSKHIIDIFLPLEKSIIIFDKFFYLTKVYNEGISFSMLSGQRLLIVLITVIIFIFLIKYMRHFKDNFRNVIAYSFVLGGLLGNLIDRIIHNYVIDFLDFYIAKYNFPVFNFADTFICIGIVLLLISIYRGEDNDYNS